MHHQRDEDRIVDDTCRYILQGYHDIDERSKQKLLKLEKQQQGSFIAVGWRDENGIRRWAVFYSPKPERIELVGDDYYEAKLIVTNGRLPLATPPTAEP